jgi:hypothetical protein
MWRKLFVFRDPVRSTHRAGLDLAAVSGDGDGAVLGLAGAVTEHGGMGRSPSRWQAEYCVFLPLLVTLAIVSPARLIESIPILDSR